MAEAGLKSANEADLASYEDIEMNKSSSPDDVEYAHAYLASAVNSQKIWEEYRDLCLDLAKRIYKDKDVTLETELSMRQALTQVRIGEIKAPL